MFNLSSIVFAACAALTPAAAELPEIALIIDDIGYHYDDGRAAIELRHSFAYAVLPFSPHGQALARLANALDKDVMMHLPMEADDDNHLLGPGALRLGMSRREIENTFLDSLAAVPYAIGVNNHMGSRLTREPPQMSWLMHAIHARGGLFFVDSRTTSRSVAVELARTADVAFAVRDVFLDNVKTRRHIQDQLNSLVAQARKNGRALGIAHPHPETIQVLKNWRPARSGVRLVRISEYVRPRDHGAAASRPTDPLRSAAAECGEQSDNANPAQDPNIQR